MTVLDERPRYRTAEQELADALMGVAPHLAHEVACDLGPARTAQLAKAIDRAVAKAFRDHVDQEVAERLHGLWELVQAGAEGIPAECGTAEEVRACRVCGCTDEDGCEFGCWWVGPDLCSGCQNGPEAGPWEPHEPARPGSRRRGGRATGAAMTGATPELGSPEGDGVEVGSGRVEPVVSASALHSPPSGLPTRRGGAAPRAPPAHAPTCPLVCCTSPYDPAVVGPYTVDEFDALISSVWSLDTDDPFRFDELLNVALGFIGRIALDGSLPKFDRGRAAELLRAMEQRAVHGPDHPVRAQFGMPFDDESPHVEEHL
jgi:hypothetical protein